MEALLSVLGLYNADNTVLDGLAEGLPEGVELEDIKTNILMECAELEIIFPRPDTFKSLLTNWAKTRKTAWARYFAAINAEYDPIENYNRYETETGTAAAHGEGTVENDVSAWNDTAYSPKDKTETENDTYGTNTRNSRTHGNIGVTTSQRMVTAELDLSDRLNIAQKITTDFKMQFCILVY